MTATAIPSLGEVTEMPKKAGPRTYTVDYVDHKVKIVREPIVHASALFGK